MGIMDASRESCNNCLQRGPGSAILLVLGGAKESLDAHAHTDYELTLHRCGFVKVALENQADLVPVFSFGEVSFFVLFFGTSFVWNCFLVFFRFVLSRH